MTNRKKRVAILISGRGSNMAALIAAAAEPDFPAEIAGVIADRTDARGLERAGALGVPVQAITPQEHPDKQALDSALDAALGNLGAEYVCLAGYMRLLSPAFVEKWSGRLINIHPSLLPLFKGLDSHRSCLEAGMRIHGCTVHFVTAEMDAGPIVAQAAGQGEEAPVDTALLVLRLFDESDRHAAETVGSTLTLALGLTLNLFTAVLVTRTFLYIFILGNYQKVEQRKWLLGV